MILKQCLYDLVDLVGADITNGEAGSDDSGWNFSQTGVISAIAATDIVLSDVTISGNIIACNYILDTSTANTETLAEFEVNDGSAVAYNRCTISSFTKTSEMEFSLFNSFEFRLLM